jgi:hypothetical protein
MGEPDLFRVNQIWEGVYMKAMAVCSVRANLNVGELSNSFIKVFQIL